MAVKENIKRIRKEKEMTQEQLGELCNPKISASTIRKYELGILKPKIETINKIAIALGGKTADLLELEYFDSITDPNTLKSEISRAEQFEKLFISMYGADKYDSFMQYSVLTEEGQRKVKDYINDLFTNPAYRTDI